MSRPAQIAFLSRWARAYDPVVRWMGFVPLWAAVAEVAAPRAGEWALDVCTGTGGVALELARRGARVVGVDLAEGMVRHAHRKRKANGSERPARSLPGAPHPSPTFFKMDARHLGFADRAFSLITCTMALHEMAESERGQVLREIVRVARGRVVLAEYRVPRHRLKGALFRMTRAFEYVESDDFAHFVRHDVGDRLARAGLRVGTPRDVGGYRIWPCHVGDR